MAPKCIANTVMGDAGQKGVILKGTHNLERDEIRFVHTQSIATTDHPEKSLLGQSAQ